MTDTRKFLVHFDPSDPDQPSSDFLVPIVADAGDVQLLGIRSHRLARYGMVVLTNRAVTPNDLLAKMVDSRFNIPDVDAAMRLLTRFVDALRELKPGNVIELLQNEGGFEVAMVAKTPSGFRSTPP